MDHIESSSCSTEWDRSGALDTTPCLEGEGCLQTLIPSSCSRPYLERLGLELYEDESTGALQGYDIASGENYGGPDGLKIPPQVIHAYMLAHPVEKEPAWQTVPPPKGKRGHTSS